MSFLLKKNPDFFLKPWPVISMFAYIRLHIGEFVQLLRQLFLKEESLSFSFTN